MGEVLDKIKSTRLAAIVQAPQRDDLMARAMAAAKGGIELLALPVSVPFVAEIAAEVADEADVIVGLSDVVHGDHLNVALAAGAEFVISPIFDPELIESGKKRGLEVFPSVSTPNEVHHHSDYEGMLGIAHAHGLGGPDYIAFLHAAFPGVDLLALGGVGSDTAPHYLELGAAAVIVDTGLFPAELDPDSEMVIRMRASALVELCTSAVAGERQSRV